MRSSSSWSAFACRTLYLRMYVYTYRSDPGLWEIEVVHRRAAAPAPAAAILVIETTDDAMTRCGAEARRAHLPRSGEAIAQDAEIWSVRNISDIEDKEEWGEDRTGSMSLDESGELGWRRRTASISAAGRALRSGAPPWRVGGCHLDIDLGDQHGLENSIEKCLYMPDLHIGWIDRFVLAVSMEILLLADHRKMEKTKRHCCYFKHPIHHSLLFFNSPG